MKVWERQKGFDGRHKNEKQMLYIVDTYGNMILALIEKHLFTLPHKQESCVNDVLIQLWEHLDCFDDDQSTLQSWVGAVTRYRCLVYLKECREVMDSSAHLPVEGNGSSKEDKMMSWLIDREIEEEEEMMQSCLSPEEGKILLAGGAVVYRILNRVETDFYEYETNRNLPQELEMMKKNLRKKIREQYSGIYVREGLFGFLESKRMIKSTAY